MGQNQKGFSIIEVLLVIVIIGIVGVLGWIFFSRQKNSTNNNKISSTTLKRAKEEVKLKPEQVTSKIKAHFATNYRLLNLDDNNNPKDGEMSIRIVDSSPAYKVEGYNFYTDYAGGSEIHLMPGDNGSYDTKLPYEKDTQVRNEVAKIYISLGLTKTVSGKDQAYRSGLDAYIGKGLICTIDMPTFEASSSSASCGSLDAYKNAAAQTKPLADVMPGIEGTTMLVGLKITNSEVSGYQKATVSLSDINGRGGSVALLYKRDGQKWNYFTNTQNLLPCSAYNNTDLRNAFRGDGCYHVNDNETITSSVK